MKNERHNVAKILIASNKHHRLAANIEVSAIRVVNESRYRYN